MLGMLIGNGGTFKNGENGMKKKMKYYCLILNLMIV
jgi:hypothetical protein